MVNHDLGFAAFADGTIPLLDGPVAGAGSAVHDHLKQGIL